MGITDILLAARTASQAWSTRGMYRLAKELATELVIVSITRKLRLPIFSNLHGVRDSPEDGYSP